jgi:hypothetical protein
MKLQKRRGFTGQELCAGNSRKEEVARTVLRILQNRGGDRKCLQGSGRERNKIIPGKETSKW